jgi:hypothetical protein
MPGLGRKIFTAGDVLTASDVQSYLQDQAVMVFAGTAARSSAIATPSEGMFAITKDNDELDYYDGSAWVPALPVGAWTSYTPVWSGGGTPPTIGNGTATGVFCQIGKTVHFALNIVLGSTSTVGTSTRYSFTLPVTGKNNQLHWMVGAYFDSSTSNYYPLICRTSTLAIETAFYSMGPSGIVGNTLSATDPVVPALGDIYTFNGTYEVA